MTGNGFDLHFGLPTAYKDFIIILSSLESISSYTFENIYLNSSNYTKIVSSYNKDISFNPESIENLEDLLKQNLWFRFFRSELEIESWIDFETKIEYVLKLIFSSVKYFQEKIFDLGSLKIGNRVSKSTLFNNNIEIIEVLNFFKIIEWNVESGELRLKEEFFIQKYGYNTGVNTEKIVKHLHTEFLGFREIFNLYFTIFVAPLYENLIDKSLDDRFKTINYHFTFNYTPTFNKMCGTKISTNYLHGQIGDGTNLVLGINDIPDNVINKIHYIPFTKYFQKLNGNTDFHFLNKIEKNTFSGYQFFFYGHSLDISDQEYINEVFDFIDKIKTIEIRKIIIVIHNIESKAKLLVNLINIRGKDDIVKKMKENILRFVLLDSEGLNYELNVNINRSITF
ncbi:AbiH family protein [Chryseobacterium aquaticum]|uniref:AbiH family protein n=1 Tax=Chryseobacterium aquaticum TaxID=452084 RepID=UPI002FCA40BE